MSGSGKGIAALFASAFLLTLLINAPASLLDGPLQKASQGRLGFADASGTIWSGAATPVLRTRDGNLVALRPLRWDIAAWPLLGGKIEARLQWGSLPSSPAMTALLTFDQAELHHVEALVPAQVLEAVSPMLKPAQFHGQLRLQSEKLLFSARGIEGTAILDWRQAGSALSSIDPLGDYRMNLNGTGDRVNIVLATLSGKLLLDGQGNWSAARGLEFLGKAQASPESRSALAELLRNLGPEESPGVHGFSITPRQ